MAPGPSSKTEQVSLRVLAVDDDLRTLAQLEGFVAETGLPFECCSDPRDAIRRCRNAPGRYGLVLMDMHFFCGARGFEAARRISENQAMAPPAVVGMTGLRDFLQCEKYHNWGMVDVIAKPLFKWLVIGLVEKYCR